jgi:MFS family permease
MKRVTQAPEDRRMARRRLLILIGSVGMLFVSGGGMFTIVVALKDIAMEFGWPRAVPSFAFSLQYIGSGIGGIVMGYALDRFGFVVPAVVGAVMVGTGALLASQIDAAWQLYVIYGVMFGLSGQGSLAAPALANIARWYEDRRGMAVGITASGQSLAGIIWPPIFGWALITLGWRDMYFWFGVFALCTMLPLCLLVYHRPPAYHAPPAEPKETAPATDANSTRTAPAVSLRPAPTPRAIQVWLSVAIIGCCIAMSLPLGHLVALVSDIGYPITDAVEVLSITLMASFVSRSVMVGFLSDRFGGMIALMIFAGLQAATLGAFAMVSELWAFYVISILYGLGYGGIFPVYAVAVRDHLPAAQAGRRTGIIFMFGAVAMGLGSWMGGVLFDLTGSYTLPFLIGVATNLVMLAIVATLAARLGLFGSRHARNI